MPEPITYFAGGRLTTGCEDSLIIVNPRCANRGNCYVETFSPQPLPLRIAAQSPIRDYYILSSETLFLDVFDDFFNNLYAKERFAAAHERYLDMGVGTSDLSYMIQIPIENIKHCIVIHMCSSWIRVAVTIYTLQVA